MRKNGATPFYHTISTLAQQKEVLKMARKPMITRTITTTTVRVLCLDVENERPVTEDVTLPRTYDSDKKLMKAIESAIGSDTLKPAKIIATEVMETLYGMTEEAFIANAEILPPRTQNNEKESD